MTGMDSLKAKNIECCNRVSICVDDQSPPFSFVTIFGIARIYQYNQTKLFKWATKIAERYWVRIRLKRMAREIVAKTRSLYV